MKFLADAPLPLRLAPLPAAAGHDVVHSSQLSDGNRTPDAALASIAAADNRVMITKDRDFEVSHLVTQVPRQLLLITTGNIANNDLLNLVTQNIGIVEQAFEEAHLVLAEPSVVEVPARVVREGGERLAVRVSRHDEPSTRSV